MDEKASRRSAEAVEDLLQVKLLCRLGLHKWRRVNSKLAVSGMFEDTFRCVRPGCNWGKTQTILGTIIHPDPEWKEK